MSPVSTRSGTSPAPGASAGAGRFPARAGGSARPRSGGRTLQGQVVTRRSGGRTQQGTITRRQPAAATPRQPANAPSSTTANAPSSTTSRSGRRTQRRSGRLTTSRSRSSGQAPTGNYQPVILAEYVGVILILATSPIVTNKSPGQSPYMGQNGSPVVKIAAATLLYTILAFISVAGQGAARLAAWFGGLTLIAVGLAEGANVAKEIGLFTGGLAAAAAGEPSGGSALSQGELTASELQAQGNVQAINEGHGLGAQAAQGLELPPAVAGPGVGATAWRGLQLPPGVVASSGSLNFPVGGL